MFQKLGFLHVKQRQVSMNGIVQEDASDVTKCKMP